jgi:sensor histidine kinase YesM
VSKSGGYGLTNVRQRLEGYFGSAAALEVERDEAGGLTTVRVRMPLERTARQAGPAAAAQGSAP